MMAQPALRSRLPGWIGTGLLILTSSLWTFWGMAEMYYEGCGMPFPKPLAYLVPAAICLTVTVIALTWPRVGGWVLIAGGGLFTAWWWTMAIRRAGASLEGLLSMVPVSALVVVTGVLFLFEARHQRRRQAAGWTPPANWFRRNLRYLLALGIPLVVVAAVSVTYLPILVARQDSGYRGASSIEGNGVTLVWAPAGPGWGWGGSTAEENLSWSEIARYGLPPVGVGEKPGLADSDATAADMAATGLCRYLSADGQSLMEEAQDIWRMPTTDEVVRSLVLHGENAGCRWDGISGHAACDVRPDKETPLWAPDQSVIYYWTADAYDAEEAYYVSYNGQTVDYQAKSWGNPRHGYRCVREP